jgi:hypothetical protein
MILSTNFLWKNTYNGCTTIGITMYYWSYLVCIFGIIWHVLLELFGMYYWNYLTCIIGIISYVMYYWNYLACIIGIIWYPNSP